MLAWSIHLAGRLDEHVIDSELLRGNPLGDPHERPLWVYVPPGYDDEPERRYPTVYVIQGYTGHLAMWRNRQAYRQPFPETADAVFASVAVETLVSKGTNYVVAKVDPPDKLADLRNHAWDGLMSWLEGLGASNSEAFARKSSVIDLRGKTWLPHITMAKDAKAEPVVLSSPLEVRLGPLRLHS